MIRGRIKYKIKSSSEKSTFFGFTICIIKTTEEEILYYDFMENSINVIYKFIFNEK